MTIREQIRATELFISGQEFTSKQMQDATGASQSRVATQLRAMIEDFEVTLVQNNTSYVYRRAYKPLVHTIRFSANTRRCLAERVYL